MNNLVIKKASEETEEVAVGPLVQLPKHETSPLAKTTNNKAVALTQPHAGISETWLVTSDPEVMELGGLRYTVISNGLQQMLRCHTCRILFAHASSLF